MSKALATRYVGQTLYDFFATYDKQTTARRLVEVLMCCVHRTSCCHGAGRGLRRALSFVMHGATHSSERLKTTRYTAAPALQLPIWLVGLQPALRQTRDIRKSIDQCCLKCEIFTRCTPDGAHSITSALVSSLVGPVNAKSLMFSLKLTGCKDSVVVRLYEWYCQTYSPNVSPTLSILTQLWQPHDSVA
eukprot:3889237-Pleurochrysis_carterae.AAC.1